MSRSQRYTTTSNENNIFLFLIMVNLRMILLFIEFDTAKHSIMFICDEINILKGNDNESNNVIKKLFWLS